MRNQSNGSTFLACCSFLLCSVDGAFHIIFIRVRRNVGLGCRPSLLGWVEICNLQSCHVVAFACVPPRLGLESFASRGSDRSGWFLGRFFCIRRACIEHGRRSIRCSKPGAAVNPFAAAEVLNSCGNKQALVVSPYVPLGQTRSVVDPLRRLAFDPLAATKRNYADRVLLARNQPRR